MMDSWESLRPHVFTNSTKALQDTSHSPSPTADSWVQRLAMRISSSSRGRSPLAHTTSSTRRGQCRPHPAQDVLDDGAAEVQVGDGDLLPEEGPELVLVEEEVHDQVDLGRVAHQGVPAALLEGAEVLARGLAHHVDAQVLQVNVLLRGQREQQLVAQQVVVERQLPQAVALVGHAQYAWGEAQEEGRSRGGSGG